MALRIDDGQMAFQQLFCIARLIVCPTRSSIRRSNTDADTNPQVPEKEESLPGANEDPDINKINEALAVIAELNSVAVSAHEVAKNFLRMHGQAEIDRYMKQLAQPGVTFHGAIPRRRLPTCSS